MIHGIFVVADLTTSDKMVRTGTQLLKAFGEFNAATALTHGHLLSEMVAQARQAIAEGDLRDGLDPETVGEVIVGAMTEELAIGHYFKRLTAMQYEFGTTDHHVARYAQLSRRS